MHVFTKDITRSHYRCCEH